MSETTSDSTASATSASASGDFDTADTEPSMEDILASIRKIIADDGDPVPLEGPVSETVEVDPAATVVDMAPVDFQPAETEVAVDDSDLDLDSLLTEMDMLADEPVAEIAVPAPEVETPAAPVEASVAPVADIDESQDESDEMDRLMNELLVGLDEELPPVATEVQAEPETPAKTASADPADVGTGEDMDLVKSLMADLTDEDVGTAVQTSDSLIEADADLAIPPEPVTDSADDDVLDSILNMTLEDEIAALERQIDAEAGAADVAEETASDDSAPSLAEIADAAEADATASEPAGTNDASAVPVVAAAAASAALLGGATIAASDDPVTEAKATPDAKTAEPEIKKVETPMPSALRSDAILDEVTEEASMTAFAELNQVVEEKAVFNERGPRIGDLVQEALKPMLKEWLDANLKGIVERAVAKEVKRISTGK